MTEDLATYVRLPAEDMATLTELAGAVGVPMLIKVARAVLRGERDHPVFADSFSGQGKQILTPRSRKEILSPQLPAFNNKLRNPGISYGLGWDFAGLPEFSKQGLFLLGKSGGTGMKGHHG